MPVTKTDPNRRTKKKMRTEQFVGPNRLAVPFTLKRTRLFVLLNSYRTKPLIWIRAPAGSGKSTLAASYIDDQDLNCMWYSCEKADGDLATFFYHLRAADNRLNETRKKKLPLLQPEYALGLTTFGRNFFRTLYSKIPRPGLLVIDDYHLIPLESVLHEIIRDSLEELPAGLTLVIISRQNPPMIFGRLRVDSYLAEIGPKELAFTLSESEALIKLRKKNKLITATHLKRWHEKTQGWIAGLILYIDQSEKSDDFVFSDDEIATDHIFDYFAGELFEGLEENIKKFLATVSLLRVFTASCAAELTTNDQARRILREFSSKELFISRHGRYNPEYQFHPLLREFLQAQLEEMYGGDDVLGLKRKAAGILDKEGHWVDAAEIYHNIKDHHSLVELLKSTAPKAIKFGRHNLLKRWISSLPGRILDHEPWLKYWLGISLVQFEPIDARPHFESALTEFLRLGDARGTYLSWAGLADSISFGVHSFTEAPKWLEEFSKIRSRWPRYPGFEAKARVTFSTLNLLAHCSVDREEMKPWVASAERLLRFVPVRSLRVAFGMELGIHYNLTGQVGKLQVIRALFHKIANNEEAIPMERIIAWVGIAASTWTVPEREYTDGLVAVDSALQLAAESGVHIFDSITGAQGVYICLQANELDGAWRYLKQVDDFRKTKQFIHRAHYHTLRSHLESESGDHATALEHARESVRIIEEHAAGMMPEFPFRCTLGLQLIEMGQHEEGMKHLEAAETVFKKMSSPVSCFMVNGFKARSALIQRDFETAAALLKLGLGRARDAGISGFGHWRPSVMRQLLQFALERNIETDYVRKLIRLSNLVPDTPPVHIPYWPWQVEIHTLGGFKLYINGELLTFKRKTQKKPIELLKAIVAKGGENIAIERLMDSLWPDSEGDAAKSVFDSTLHRLRKLLVNDKVIALRDGHLSLDFRRCWVDTFALSRTMDSVPEILSASNLEEFVDHVLALYRGDFLAGEQESWMLAQRDRVKIKVVQCLRSAIVRTIDSDDINRLEEVLDCILERFPESEVFYALLMRTYVEQGRNADAVSTYHRCDRMLQSALGVPPSMEMQKLRDVVRNNTC